MKLYKCDRCGREVQIRSTLKGGDKVCPLCYSKEKPLKGGFRKEKRDDLKVYFEYHIPRACKCENCGKGITSPASTNVAHILPKSFFKSVRSNLKNFMYLCGDCHQMYDYSWAKAKTMKVWALACERFEQFKDEIKEKSINLLNFYNAEIKEQEEEGD